MCGSFQGFFVGDGFRKPPQLLGNLRRLMHDFETSFGAQRTEEDPEFTQARRKRSVVSPYGHGSKAKSYPQ